MSKQKKRQKVTSWARRVGPAEPHGLRELEDRIRAGENPDKGVRPMTIVGILAMIAGLAVTMDASDGIRGSSGLTHYFDFDPEIELPVMLVCFLAVSAFQAWVLRNWLANGRVRDTSTLIASACAAATGGYATALTWARLDLDYPDPLKIALYATPPFLALVLGLIGVVVGLVGRRPAHWRSWFRGPTTVNLAALPRARRAKLVAERNAALDVLADRGLLDDGGAALESLKARPLGLLAG